MFPRALVSFALLSCACSDEADPDISPSKAALESGPTAPLAELSDGECPDMSGTSRFSSGGLSRRVRIVTPRDVTPGMPVVFAFHGLVPAGFDAISNMVDGFGLKDIANERGVIFVVPEARELVFPGVGALLLWGVLDDAEADLALFDDVRTCLSNELDVDLERLHAWGFSGGAMWTSVVLVERSETLASAVEFSGGASFIIPFIGGPYAHYMTPPNLPPTLLASGGAMDVWPDPQLLMVDFEESTDLLGNALQSDGGVVARCYHDLGHNIPSDYFDFSIDWMLDHTFTGASPWADGTGLPSGCTGL
jgi:poly(3-hydroxybutyrate) depolymerase